jgi:hypothetical protein
MLQFSWPMAASLVGALLAGSSGRVAAAPDLPNFTEPELQQLLLSEAAKARWSGGVADVTDQVVSPRIARACRMGPQERSAFASLEEQTIVPASAHDKRLSEFRDRCQLRVLITGSKGHEVVHAIYNGPQSPGRAGLVGRADPVSLRIVVLTRRLDSTAFKTAALKLARSFKT